MIMIWLGKYENPVTVEFKFPNSWMRFEPVRFDNGILDQINEFSVQHVYSEISETSLRQIAEEVFASHYFMTLDPSLDSSGYINNRAATTHETSGI